MMAVMLAGDTKSPAASEFHGTSAVCAAIIDEDNVITAAHDWTAFHVLDMKWFI